MSKEYKVVVEDNGNTFWYNEKDQLHRDNDLPAIECANGTKYWWVNGVRVK